MLVHLGHCELFIVLVVLAEVVVDAGPVKRTAVAILDLLGRVRVEDDLDEACRSPTAVETRSNGLQVSMNEMQSKYILSLAR